MDLRSLLNGAPAAQSSRPINHPPQSQRPPPPPPIQPPHSPFQSQQGGRFAHPPQQSPYRVSPSQQGYPFPPPSPHGQPSQQQHQQQHPGYTQSPIGTPHGTPHPLSAHSTLHSATPTSAASPTSQHQFSGQNQPHQYAMQQGPLQTPPTHTPPSPMNQFGPHPHQHGYSRQSPMASPVDGRSGSFHPPPSIATPSRDRERERSVLRDRERDISISPKTKVPFLADEEPSPAGATPAKERQSFGIETITGGPSNSAVPRPSSHHPQPPPPITADGGRYRRDSSVGTNTLERQSMDIDEPERKWSSPVSDRSKTNGSSVEVGEHHNSNHHRGSQGPSSNSSAHRGPVPSPTSKEQHVATPSSAQMPTPASNRPTSPSPKVQQPQQTLGPPPTPTHQSSSVDGRSGSPGSGGPPRKRLRRDEAPIWARKASRSSSSSPVMAAKRQPSSVQSAHLSSQQQNVPAPPPQPSAPSQQNQQPPQVSPQPQATQSQPPVRGLAIVGLGPWEHSIKGAEVMDDLSIAVADFLFQTVVRQTDPALISDGGALIEIEAKIGQLVDKNTNERLRLPVTTETAMNRDDPSLRIQFRSSMTELQHKGYNIFLNKLFGESKGPPRAQHSGASPADDTPPRIPMEYAHTRERDSFFELPSDKYHILPPSIRATLNPRHKLRVRVTTDQKTGRVLKKIVKARIADLNIYSPMAAFDWRISVNMEMPYEGDTEKLYPLGGGTGSSDGDRNKDRMSYRHLIYQVDLTQVTDKTAKKEHELEVEVNAKEIRKHGLGALDKRPNAYPQLVKGFVDNVRTLIREIP